METHLQAFSVREEKAEREARTIYPDLADPSWVYNGSGPVVSHGPSSEYMMHAPDGFIFVIMRRNGKTKIALVPETGCF